MGEVTICEINSELGLFAYQAFKSRFNLLILFSKVSIHSPNDNNLMRYNREGGVNYPHIQIPDHLPADPNKQSLNALDSSIFSPISKKTSLLNLIMDKLSFFSLVESETNSISTLPTKSSQTSQPTKSSIISFSWHKNKQVFAIALKNNQIYIYDLLLESNTTITTTIKSKNYNKI